MKITLNSSCTTNKDMIVHSPISGDLKVASVQNGTFSSTFAIAEIKDAKGGYDAPEVGKTCTQYGEGGSGGGIVVQTTIAMDGGSNGSPYAQTITSILGAL